MATTEIYLDDRNLTFVVGWRQRTGQRLFLVDENARRVGLRPVFELPDNPHDKFDARTAERLRAKFEGVDRIFAEELT